MKKYRVGLIRVLTTDDTQLMQMHGALIEQYFPMLQVESRCIPDQPEGIHDDQTMALGVPKVVAMAKECGKRALTRSLSAVPETPELHKRARQFPSRSSGLGRVLLPYACSMAATPLCWESPRMFRPVISESLAIIL